MLTFVRPAVCGTFRLLTYLFWVSAALPLFAQNDPQFVTVGSFQSPFEPLNQLATAPLDYDGNGTIDLVVPCSCREAPVVTNGAFANGVFDNQLIIATGLSGQNWQLQNGINLLHPVSLQPLLSGTPFTEIGTTGVYRLSFAHYTDQIYYATAENPAEYPGQTFGPVFGECFYPQPAIENLNDFFCADEPDIVLFGSATSGFDDNFLPLTPTSELWIIQRQEDLEVFLTQVFSPSTLGEGTYTIRYVFNASANAYTDPMLTGCSAIVEEEVIVREAADMVCFTELNVTLGPNCEGTIFPQQLLASPQNTYQAFTINIFDGDGNDLGDYIPAAYHGQTLTARITDDCSDLFCETSLNVFDITPPALSIPDNLTVSCTESTDTVAAGVATATDCSDVAIGYVDDVINSDCGNPTQRIFRTWTATDLAGNSTSLTQTIEVARGSQAQLVFPPDMELSCAEVAATPALAAPGPLGTGLPNLVDDPRCGLLYTHSDDTLQVCGGSEFIILRTWTVIDQCGNTIFTVDGQGNDNIQFIRVADNTAPVVTAGDFTVPANAFPTSPGDPCTSTGVIPAPIGVADDCSPFFVRIFTPIGEVEYIDGQDGTAGGIIPSPGLPLGDHSVIYAATDECGNTDSLIVTATVMDVVPPMMLCNNQLTVSLSATGFARVYPDEVDEGSNDACCTGDFQIKLQNEPDSLYRDFLEFFCTNNTVTATLQLSDCDGNTNTCNIDLTVEDREAIQIVSAPADVTVSCLDSIDHWLDSAYLAPVFADNCTYAIDWSVDLALDDCGIGTITRQWVAVDNPGNTPAQVAQVITVEAAHDYRINLPSDADVDCDNLSFLTLSTTDMACDSLVVTITEETYTEPDDAACYRIRRTYDIINYCEWDGMTAPTLLPRMDNADPDMLDGDPYVVQSDGVLWYEVVGPNLIDRGPSTGYYRYEQVIAVFDDEAPTLMPQDMQVVCQDSVDCRGAITLDIFSQDNCGPIDAVTYLLRPAGAVAAADSLGTLQRIDNDHYRIDGRYPVGDYEFVVTGVDACGNSTNALYPFTIEDCFAPMLTCRQDSVIGLDGMQFLITPDAFVIDATDFCNTALPLVSYSPTLDDTLRMYDCDSLGIRQLTLYATDAAGNQSSCDFSFEITDPAGLCTPRITVDGFVRTETGAPVRGAWVHLMHDDTLTAYTDTSGYYRFVDVASDVDYTMTVEKDTLPKNGISTFDIIFMRRHILDVLPLDSPYKMLAADVNNSGSISTFDVIQTRKLILDIDTAFANVPSWRFLPADYVFPDTLDPWSVPLPWTTELHPLTDVRMDWIAMKMADLNNSVNAQTLSGGTVSPYGFGTIPYRTRSSDQDLTVLLDLSAYAGAQFTLTWAAADWRFELADLNGSDASAYINDRNSGNGRMSLAWNREAGITENILQLHFRANGSTTHPLQLALVDAPGHTATGLRPEVYEETGTGWLTWHPLLEPAVPVVASTDFTAAFRPNPFGTTTELAYTLSASTSVQLTVFDQMGRLVYQITLAGEAGENHWLLDADLLPAAGIYFYQLQVPGKRCQGKLVRW